MIEKRIHFEGNMQVKAWFDMFQKDFPKGNINRGD